MIVQDLNFRYYCKEYVIVESPGIARYLGGPPEADGVLLAGFIHPEDGMCFLSVDTAVCAEGKRVHQTDCPHIFIRENTLLRNAVQPYAVSSEEEDELERIYEKAVLCYRPSRSLEALRADVRLDHWRLRQYPDHLCIPVSDDGEVTVQMEGIRGRSICGTVTQVRGTVNDLKQGDAVRVGFMKKTDRCDLFIWKRPLQP